MKLTKHFQKTALHIAVEKENIEIIECFIANPKIKMNEIDQILNIDL